MHSAAARIRDTIEEAIYAHEQGDLDMAIAKLETVQMLMASMPDSQWQHQGLTWDRRALKEMLEDLRKKRAAGHGIRRSPIEWKGASEV